MNATASRMQVVLNYLLIFLCSAIAIYPLIGVLMASFYPSGQAFPCRASGSPGFEWQNYTTAWNQGRFLSTSRRASSWPR